MRGDAPTRSQLLQARKERACLMRPDRRAGARRVRGRLELERRRRAAAGEGREGDGSGESRCVGSRSTRPTSRACCDETPGPILAVGHSYGGAVLTNAATNAANVVGLVYVAAFAPDEGEVLGEVTAGSKDSVLDTALVPCTTRRRRRRVGGGVRDRPGQVPRRVRRRPAREQSAVHGRHAAARRRAAFSSRRGRPLEASALLGRRRSSDTARAPTSPFDGGTGRRDDHRARGLHVIMISQPEAVTDVILEALSRSVQGGFV